MTPCFNKLLPLGGEIDVDIVDMVAMVGSLHCNEICVNCDLENTTTWKMLNTSCVIFRDNFILPLLGLVVLGI